MAEGHDQVARDKANDAVHQLRNHITVTDIKLQNLEKKIDSHHEDQNGKLERLESILKWAGGLIVMLFLSTLTWSLAQQYNANESSKQEMSQQIELLKQQQRTEAAAKIDRQQIIEHLTRTGGAEPSVPSDAGR